MNNNKIITIKEHHDNNMSRTDLWFLTSSFERRKTGFVVAYSNGSFSYHKKFEEAEEAAKIKY